MPTRATCAKEAPAAPATAFRFSNTRRACAVMSPGTSAPVAGSIGVWPEKYSVLPQRTACEYGPMALGASGEAMIWRDMGASCVGSRASIASVRHCLRVPIDPMYHRRIAHPAHHVREVLAIAHLDGEHQGGGLLIALLV